MDSNEDGTISLDELTKGFESQADFRDTLKLMDIDQSDLDTVFAILDEDQSGHISYKEFAAQFLRMKSHDTHTMIVFIKHFVTTMGTQFMDEVMRTRERLSAELEDHVERLSCAFSVEQQAAPTDADIKPVPLQAIKAAAGAELVSSTAAAAAAGDREAIKRELGRVRHDFADKFEQLQRSNAALVRIVQGMSLGGPTSLPLQAAAKPEESEAFAAGEHSGGTSARVGALKGAEARDASLRNFFCGGPIARKGDRPPQPDGLPLRVNGQAI